MEGLGSRDPCSELKGYDLLFGGGGGGSMETMQVLWGLCWLRGLGGDDNNKLYQEKGIRG